MFFSTCPSRRVVLPLRCFDSKTKFKTILREKFGGGTFMLSSKVQGAELTDYYKFLKRQYVAGPARKVHASKYRGDHGMNYWVLSDQVRYVQKQGCQTREIAPEHGERVGNKCTWNSHAVSRCYFLGSRFQRTFGPWRGAAICWHREGHGQHVFWAPLAWQHILEFRHVKVSIKMNPRTIKIKNLIWISVCWNVLHSIYPYL